MYKFDEQALRKGINIGLGSQGIWTPELEDVMFNEITNEALRIHDVSGQSEQLVNFLLHLNSKELINNHDFDYEKEAKKYLKKIN